MPGLENWGMAARVGVAVMAVAGFGPPVNHKPFAPPTPDEVLAAEACATAPNPQCVLDVIWARTDELDRTYAHETLAGFLEVAVDLADPVLLDAWLERTGIEARSETAVSARLRLAANAGDNDTVRAIADGPAGADRSPELTATLALALDAVGEHERARVIAARLVAPESPSRKARRVHEELIEALGPRPKTLADWAGDMADGNAAWDAATRAALQDWAAQFRMAAAAAPAPSVAYDIRAEVHGRFRSNGYDYMRALAFLAPDLGDGLGEGFAMDWLEPLMDGPATVSNPLIAEYWMIIAARLPERPRAALLAAFDRRLPRPEGKVAALRALAGDPQAPASGAGLAAIGGIGGGFAERKAAAALAELEPAAFLAAAQAGAAPHFNIGRAEALAAAAGQVADPAFRADIMRVMIALAEAGEGSFERDTLAREGGALARELCDADARRRAEALVRGTPATLKAMRDVRFGGTMADALMTVLRSPDAPDAVISGALQGYREGLAQPECAPGAAGEGAVTVDPS